MMELRPNVIIPTRGRILRGSNNNGAGCGNWLVLDNTMLSSAKPAPPTDEGPFDTKLVEDLGDGMVDQIGDRLRTSVETGHGREHYRTCLSDLGHQAQVAKMEGCLTDHQDKFSALLQAHVGGTGNEICVV